MRPGGIGREASAQLGLDRVSQRSVKITAVNSAKVCTKSFDIVRQVGAVGRPHRRHRHSVGQLAPLVVLGRWSSSKPSCDIGTLCAVKELEYLLRRAASGICRSLANFSMAADMPPAGCHSESFSPRVALCTRRMAASAGASLRTQGAEAWTATHIDLCLFSSR